MMRKTLLSAAMTVAVLWGDAPVAQAGGGAMQSFAEDAITERASSRLAGYLLATMNSTNTGSWTFDACQKGCSDSYDYCLEHQSTEMDCNLQADACYRWCDDEFDQPPIVASQPPASQSPKTSLPGATLQGSPRPRMQAPGQAAPRLGPKPLLRRGLKKTP